MEKKSSSQEIVEPERERLEEEEEEEEEEEYVLLDLESISEHIGIPANAPYVLSGLDTANPILLIDNKLKLIGEYEETIGTCIVFSENDGDSIVYEDAAGPSDSRQTPTTSKQINPMAKLNKVLKFRPYLESGEEDSAEKPS
ncbi:hypothetical protein ACS0TY_016946 [Phlomoides rotata]